MGKNVTIRELKGAAKARGWLSPKVTVWRTGVAGVYWGVSVYPGDANANPYLRVDDHSRQGAMRMALGALKAGKR